MANVAYLASTLVMGALGVGVVVLVLRGRRWHHYVPSVAYGLDAGGAAPGSVLSRVAGSTNTWTLVYLVTVLGFLGGALVTLSGAVNEMALIAGLVAVIVVYIVAGVYIAMRGNGRPSSQAAAGSAVTLGFLFVAAITAKLILGL